MNTDKYAFSLVRSRAQPDTLDRQLYKQLRKAILDGRLHRGEKLPSTRQLCEQLKVSRSTVVDAYRQLIAEGYLDARVKSNTFVCLELPELAPSAAPSINLLSNLTDLGKRLMKMDFAEVPVTSLEIGFYPWRTCFDELPLQQWTKNLWRRSRISEAALLDFAPDRAGSAHLRATLAATLSKTRDITCHPDQVIIINGQLQALDLVARLFVSKGDRVAVEEPCAPQIRSTFLAHSAKLVPIDVDDSGMIIDQLARKSKLDIRIACVTPSHQFPTGAVLPMARRLELLDWARRTSCLILEDDYDSDFRFSGKPIPSLMSLDKSDCVVYIGTMSKVLYPSFGIGYMVVPKPLAALFVETRRFCADAQPLQMQEALADFIDEGHLQRHIKRMHPIYEQRRLVLVESLNQLMSDKVSIYGDHAGLHVMVRIKTAMPNQLMIQKCAAAGVGLISTEDCYLDSSSAGEFALGYGNVTEKQIRDGIQRLANVVRKAEDSTHL